MTDRYVTTRNWDLDFAEEVNIQFYIDITIFQTTTTKTTLTHTYIFHEISTINKPTNSSFAHLSIHTRKFPIHQRLPAMTPRQQDLFWRVHKNKSPKVLGIWIQMFNDKNPNISTDVRHHNNCSVVNLNET